VSRLRGRVKRRHGRGPGRRREHAASSGALAIRALPCDDVPRPARRSDVDAGPWRWPRAAVDNLQGDIVMLLIRGSVGPQVTALQENLNKIGVTVDVDGTYGAGTETAVKTFQVANAIDADGKYGPATHAKMEELLAQAGGQTQS
jgi:predicted ThiF/HesA family dinucleotide-utilizing enzyme